MVGSPLPLSGKPLCPPRTPGSPTIAGQDGSGEHGAFLPLGAHLNELPYEIKPQHFTEPF